MANYYVSFAGQQAVQTWAAIGASQTVSLGTFVRQTSPTTGNERVFKCTTAGNTGTAEPTWVLTYNGTTNESGHGGTAVWTCLGGQEADQSAGNWTAPLARLSQLAGGSNAQSGHPLAAGDTLFISSDHAETQATGYNFGAILENIRALSVTRSGSHLPPISADLTRGASVGVSANNQMLLNCEGWYWWGVDFIANTGNIEIRNDGLMYEVFENCSFQINGSGNNILIGAGSASVLGTIVWDNTYVKFNNANQGISLDWPGFEWRNTASAVQGTSPSNLFQFSNTMASKTLIHGVDLSGATTALFYTGGTPNSDIVLRDCILANGVSPFGTSHSGWNDLTIGAAQLMVDNCDDTTNNRNYRMARSTTGGAVQTTTALVRTGGMTDGVTAFSWQMVNSFAVHAAPLTLANAVRFQEIAQRWNTTGSSQTLTLYGTSSFSSIPTNGNFWIDVDYLGSSASPLASLVSSRVADALAAATNLTADTSNWTSNVAARQNSHAYSAGDLMSPSSNSTRVFICTSAGTSASSLPGGYATAVDGGTVTDSGATFMAMWRWSIAVTFTPQTAGTVKCTPKTLLGSSMTPTANLLVIDPQFIIA